MVFDRCFGSVPVSSASPELACGYGRDACGPCDGEVSGALPTRSGAGYECGTLSQNRRLGNGRPSALVKASLSARALQGSLPCLALWWLLLSPAPPTFARPSHATRRACCARAGKAASATHAQAAPHTSLLAQPFQPHCKLLETHTNTEQSGQGRSEWRPAALLAAKDVQVQVVHRLAPLGPVVDDHPEAVLLRLAARETLCTRSRIS